MEDWAHFFSAYKRSMIYHYFSISYKIIQNDLAPVYLACCISYQPSLHLLTQPKLTDFPELFSVLQLDDVLSSLGHVFGFSVCF